MSSPSNSDPDVPRSMRVTVPAPNPGPAAGLPAGELSPVSQRNTIVAEVLPRAFGKFTLLREIASGGMAKVYLAIQRAVAGFEKLVVVKRVLPELARDPNFVEMLLAEARTAATLNHQNIVHTFDVGEYEGTYFIAMEYINGEDVRSIVRAMKHKGVAEFPLEHTLTIVSGVCAGLAYAHEKRDLDGEPLQLVHRDVSPQNVLITFTGDVKIVDFGIAKSTQAAFGQETTNTGQLKGKVPYMSPEQARGDALDHRSDIFSVGIVLFELTTGRRLFKAKSDYETLRLICDSDYPRPSQIRPDYPPALEAIVMRALEKDPANRYASARDMQSDLEQFIREERIPASNIGLGSWMNFLFEDKIALQKAVLQDAKQLADVIAAQQPTTPDASGAWLSDSATSTSTTTVGAATISGTNVESLDAIRSRQTRMFVGLGVIAAVAAGLVAYVTVASHSAGRSRAASSSRVSAAPDPERGSLTVRSVPPGAYVRVAGELQGRTTPLTIERLPLGMALEVKVSLDGYNDATRTVTFESDRLVQTLEIPLTATTQRANHQ